MKRDRNSPQVPPPHRAIYKGAKRRAQPPVPQPAHDGVPAATTRRGCVSLSPFALAVWIMLLSCSCLALVGVWASQVAAPRTNVLILGLDRRPEQGDTVRSDVLMLATAHPQGSRLALLSIPRDLYVEIPGYGQGRINTAHFWGENQTPGTGPDLAMKTVSQAFDVALRHHVRVDFDAFRAIVDAAGGIDVVVEEPIIDNAYPTEDYGTTRIEIPAGVQHMDGERALQYVRSRHGASDFERADRQQQVMMALARKLMAPENWLRLPAVFQAVVANIETNLGPLEMLQLAVTLLRVGPEGMEHHVIDRDMTRPWTTPTGGSVLLPRWEAINPLVEELFSP